MCACVHICECMHVYTHVWRPEVGTGHLGCVLTYLKTEELLNLDRLWPTSPRDLSVFSSSALGLKVCIATPSFYGGPRRSNCQVYRAST